MQVCDGFRISLQCGGAIETTHGVTTITQHQSVYDYFSAKMSLRKTSHSGPAKEKDESSSRECGTATESAYGASRVETACVTGCDGDDESKRTDSSESQSEEFEEYKRSSSVGDRNKRAKLKRRKACSVEIMTEHCRAPAKKHKKRRSRKDMLR